MYTLTLTKDERSAIDWIGYRYSHGDDLYKLLCDCTWWQNSDNKLSSSLKPNTTIGELANWDYDGNILIEIPEPIAWQIRDLIDESLLDCFSEEFVAKLRDFAASVV